MVYICLSNRLGEQMKSRELIEAIIVIACGVILLSPEFNTIFYIPFLSFMENLPDWLVSHLAVALLPIIAIYFIDIFRKGKTD